MKSWRGTEFQGGVLAKVRKSLQSLAVTAYYEMIAKVRKLLLREQTEFNQFAALQVLKARLQKAVRNMKVSSLGKTAYSRFHIKINILPFLDTGTVGHNIYQMILMERSWNRLAW